MAPEQQDMQQSLQELQASVSQLADLFRRRLLDDKIKAQTIESLTKQVGGLQLQPLCREFILMLDRLETSDDDFVVSVRDETLEILSHYGLSTIRGEGVFDPIKQQIVGVKDVPDLPDGAIVQVCKAGYTLNGVVIRPQQVVVVRHQNKQPTASSKDDIPAPSEQVSAQV